MNEIEEDVFKPKKKEVCSFDEALEILAFGWVPVDKEILLDKIRIRFPHFYYIVDYFHKTFDWEAKDRCLKYSKNTGKHYIDLPHHSYRIETNEELEYYRELQKSLAIMRNIIACKTSEIKVSYIQEIFTEVDADISEFEEFKLKTVWFDSLSEYGNELIGVRNGEEYKLIIKFNTEYIYNIYKKRLEQKHCKDESEQSVTNNNKVIDDTLYTTPEIQLINAFIGNHENIPLLTQRGERNNDKLKEKLNKLNNKLGLIAKLTDNQIKGILSVIKSPEAKKAGTIPTPGNDSF